MDTAMVMNTGTTVDMGTDKAGVGDTDKDMDTVKDTGTVTDMDMDTDTATAGDGLELTLVMDSKPEVNNYFISAKYKKFEFILNHTNFL